MQGPGVDGCLGDLLRHQPRAVRAHLQQLLGPARGRAQQVGAEELEDGVGEGEVRLAQAAVAGGEGLGLGLQQQRVLLQLLCVVPRQLVPPCRQGTGSLAMMQLQNGETSIDTYCTRRLTHPSTKNRHMYTQ